MDLQSIANVNVDFYDKKYMLLNAKQNDKNSRFLLVACYNHGEFCPINIDEHSVFVRYKKSDGYGVLNICDITDDKKILVELTEQMLASAGICYADLIVASKGSARLDPDTGEIVSIDNASILSTMTFCIDVSEAAVDSSDIESSYEFNGLNETMQKSLAEYSDVILSAKSWTVGSTGKRDGEDTDNAKYYARQSSDYAQASDSSATSAADSAAEAIGHMESAQAARVGAEAAETAAKGYSNSAQTSANTAKGFRDEVVGHRFVVEGYKNQTEGYKNQAQSYVDDAESYKNESEEAAILAQSYAVGGTSKREGEDTDNAKYYCDNTKEYYDSVSEQCGYAEEYMNTTEEYMNTTIEAKSFVENMVDTSTRAFTVIGTFTYEEFLAYRDEEYMEWGSPGYGELFNISNSFTTDDTFRVVGVDYEAGTNVYWGADGNWHCLVTNNNVGSVSTTDVASVDEVKDYLGI